MAQSCAVPLPDSEGLPIGTTLQRYVLLERVGQGAMGAVYAAYDYGLDRKVAVKLLREPGHGAAQRRRLMREAQALAKLSHPNVVAVHDIGSHDDQVFIAMEFVDGPTLRRWRDAEPRSLRDLLAVFRAAGEGLAAAHAAGIVHRDFKPDNVLIDRHGRARVGDFGLATATHARAETDNTGEAIDAGEEARAGEAAGADEATRADEVSIASGTPIPREHSREQPSAPASELFGGAPLTRTGMIFGTPAYMALEQHHGKRANDPRTDQFSFAVALYESACGVHPFAAATIAEQVDNIEHGRIQPPRRRVPGWLVRALLPALAADPAHRYPSMDALLRELRDRRPTRVVAIAALVLIAAISLFVMGGMFATRHTGKGAGAADATLGGAASQQSAAEGIPGVWDPAARQRVQQAFSATKSARADQEWNRVSKQLDAYANDLRVSRNFMNSLGAAYSWQLPKGADPRGQCLDLRQYALARLVSHLSSVSAETVTRGIEINKALEPVATCVDVQELRPLSDEVQAGARKLRERDADLRALLATGQTAEALPTGQDLVAQADKLDYRPVQAEVRLTLGRLLWSHSKYSRARATLVEAVEKAGSGRVPRVAVRALVELLTVVGEEQGQYAVALEYARMARGMLEGSGGNDQLRALLDDSEGVLWLHQKQLANARPLLERGRELYLRAYGPGTHQEAAALEHLGLLAQAEQRFDDAAAHFHEAREIAERVHGLEHSVPWTFLAEEAQALIQAGRHEEAFALNQRGSKVLAEDSEVGVLFLANLGRIEQARKHHEQAWVHLARALEIIERLHGSEHLAVAEAATDLGLVLAELRRLPDAAKQLDRAAGIYKRVLGSEHPDLATALVRLGRVHLAAGNSAAAKQPLEAARAIRAQPGTAPADLAEVDDLLAQMHRKR